MTLSGILLYLLVFYVGFCITATLLFYPDIYEEAIDDREISGALTYIQQHWGNKAVHAFVGFCVFLVALRLLPKMFFNYLRR